MWSTFSEDFKEKYSLRQKQICLISNLLDSNSDMIINGISGSGKTTLIRDLLQEKKINYIKINCIQCQNKQTLISALISSLEKFFKYKLKQTTKTSHLLNRINQLYEYTQSQFEDDSKEYYFSFKDHLFYLLLDNVEKLSITPKFFTQLINIKSILKINFGIIFCGTTFHNEVILENSDLDLLPSILISPMSEQDLKRVIAKHLESKLQESDQRCYQVFGERFIKDIVSNFTLIVKSAVTLCSIALRLFKVFIYGYHQKNSPQIKDFVHLIKDDNYILARKLILQDPYLNDGDTKDFVDKIINKKAESIETFSLINPIQISKLPFYTSIVLLACWIGNRNPESTDKKLFRDYKGKQYKGKQENSQSVLKPIKIDRLIAIAQSLISLNEYIKMYNYSSDKENLSEQSFYDQSIDFYSQIASLVEMKYISIESNEGALAKTQYLSTIDEQFIQSIASQYQIRLFDYLYKRD